MPKEIIVPTFPFEPRLCFAHEDRSICTKDLAEYPEGGAPFAISYIAKRTKADVTALTECYLWSEVDGKTKCTILGAECPDLARKYCVPALTLLSSTLIKRTAHDVIQKNMKFYVSGMSLQVCLCAHGILILPAHLALVENDPIEEVIAALVPETNSHHEHLQVKSSLDSCATALLRPLFSFVPEEYAQKISVDM